MNVKQSKPIKMDLQEYEFQPVKSFMPTDTELFEEAVKRGFGDHLNPYCRYFNHLFFNGGSLKKKKTVSLNYIEKVSAYLGAFSKSMAPKHEEKEAVCAMLISECFELPEEYSNQSVTK